MRWGVLLFACFLPGVVSAQETLTIRINPQKATHPEITFEQVDKGKLQVVVTDSGVPVGELGLNDFEIRSELSQYEIRNVQPLVQTENAKVSVILCIDNSASMGEHLDILKKTLVELLDNLGPSVKIANIFFDKKFKNMSDIYLEAVPGICLYGLSQDKEEVRKQFANYLKVENLNERTPLYDEIFVAIQIIERSVAPNDRKFVIVFSDGQDNASSNSQNAIKTLAAKHPELDFFTIDFLAKTNPFLVDLAKNSNGKYFHAQKAEDLSIIFANISQDIVISMGYLITYQVPKAYITGRVLIKNRCVPPQQANIKIMPDDLSQWSQNIGINKNGVFSFEAVFPHRWQLIASAPDYLADTTEIDATEKNLYIADLFLSPTMVELKGRITDSGKKPLTMAQVIVTELETGDKLLEIFTDSTGEYKFISPVNKPVLITATKSGHSFTSMQIDKTSPATLLADISLGLTDEGFVSEFRFLFEFDSDKLNINDIATQTQLKGCTEFIVRELEKSPQRTVRLTGWTDNVGDNEYNLSLSQRRARYVGDYLIAHGIVKSRIVTEGNGISTKYDNTTEAGRAQNRRTDVAFFDRHETEINQ